MAQLDNWVFGLRVHAVLGMIELYGSLLVKEYVTESHI